MQPIENINGLAILIQSAPKEHICAISNAETIFPETPILTLSLRLDPTKALSRAYDMVLNGTELGGGSIRIHDAKVQRAVFDVLGIGEAEAEEKFSFLLDALSLLRVGYVDKFIICINT